MLSQSAPALGASISDVLPASLLLRTLRALRRCDTEVSLGDEYGGVGGEIARELNEVIDLHRRLALELGRVSHVVGKAGRLSQRSSAPDASGSWAYADAQERQRRRWLPRLGRSARRTWRAAFACGREVAAPTASPR
jgi:hypothetical protein